jgi:putative ATP-dependent endonuclease of the OLD family
MLIKSVSVKNFRCAKRGTLKCGPLTAMVGANGTGKSTYLRALNVFYDLAPKVEKRDWYNEEQNNPIEIAVTFTDLGDTAKK